MKLKPLIPLYILIILAIAIGGLNICSIHSNTKALQVQSTVDDRTVISMDDMVKTIRGQNVSIMVLQDLVAHLYGLESLQDIYAQQDSARVYIKLQSKRRRHE